MLEMKAKTLVRSGPNMSHEIQWQVEVNRLKRAPANQGIEVESDDELIAVENPSVDLVGIDICGVRVVAHIGSQGISDSLP